MNNKQEKTKLEKFYDPKNPIWMEIVIGVLALAELAGVVFAFYVATQMRSVGMFFAIIASVFVTHIIAMLLLNLIANVQKIQSNSTKLLRLAELKQEKED